MFVLEDSLFSFTDFDPLKKPLTNVSTNNIISGQDVNVLQYSLTIEK
jgi:hypothetical protein